MGTLQIQQWANDIIAQGRQTNTEKPLIKMDDYELAIATLYHIDQFRRGELNLQTLEFWPQYESALFNKEMIEDDMVHHALCIDKVKAEINRRHIP